MAEAAVRIVIVETTSTGTALTVSKVMPYVVAAGIVAWMIAHGRRARREGERIAAAQAAQPVPAANAAEAPQEPASHAPGEAEPAVRSARPAICVR